MKKIIKVSYSDVIEGFSATMTLPMFFDNLEEAINIKNILLKNSFFINVFYRNNTFRGNKEITITPKELGSPENEEWFISAIDSLDYSLMISFNDDMENFKRFKNSSIVNFEKEKIENIDDYIIHSLEYIKIKGVVLWNEWSNFSSLLNEVIIEDVKEEDVDNFKNKFKDCDNNELFKFKTNFPFYRLAY